MMRLLTSLLLLAFLAPGVFAQNADAPKTASVAASTIKGLNKGDRFELKRLKERKQVNGDQNLVLTRSLGQIGIEVLEVLPDGGRRLRWTLNSNQVEAQGDDKFKAVLAELGRLTKGKSFDFEIKADGSAGSLLNPKEVMASYESILAPFGTWMKEHEIEGAVAESILAGIRPFTAEATVEDMSLRDVRTLLYQPKSIPAADQRNDREGSLDNPFGGDPVPSKISTRWEKPDGKTPWLVHEESLDYDAAAPIMIASIETQAITQGQTLPEDFKLPRIETHDRFAILASDGRLPAKLYHEQSRSRDGRGQIDIEVFEISRVVPPAGGEPEKR